jgi:hypothetical protein
VIHKGNQFVDAMDYMQSVEYSDYVYYASGGWGSNQDGPTLGSVAAARAAQRRERASFTQHTGILLDRDGRLLHRSARIGS